MNKDTLYMKLNKSTDDDVSVRIEVFQNDLNIGDFKMYENFTFDIPKRSVLYDTIASHYGCDLPDIPQIKVFYNKSFEQRPNLFDFEDAFYADTYGIVKKFDTKKQTTSDLKILQHNYNFLPSYETCNNAKNMSREERKIFLFALAKKFEILTREQALHEYNTSQDQDDTYFVFLDGDVGFWRVSPTHNTFYPNIHFRKKSDAENCANFMNNINTKKGI